MIPQWSTKCATAAAPRNGAKKPTRPTAKASFHLVRKIPGSSSAPARNVRTIAPVPARNEIHEDVAPRAWVPINAPMINCATVPTTISESAVEIRNQIESSVATRAKTSQRAATSQTCSIRLALLLSIFGEPLRRFEQKPPTTVTRRRSHRPRGTELSGLHRCDKAYIISRARARLNPFKRFSSGDYPLEIILDRRHAAGAGGFDESFHRCDQLVQTAPGFFSDTQQRGVDALLPLRREAGNVRVNDVGNPLGKVAPHQRFDQSDRYHRRKQLPIAIEDQAHPDVRRQRFLNLHLDFSGAEWNAEC